MNEVSRNTLDIMRLDKEIKRLRKLIETSYIYVSGSDYGYECFLHLKSNKELDKIISEDIEDDDLDRKKIEGELRRQPKQDEEVKDEK